MRVVVAGGHGQVGIELLELLAEAGHEAAGLIRDPDQAPDLEQVGARPIVVDLEEANDLSGPIRGADAVVFAAGAGPGSGAERKRTVDYEGAVKLIDAARATGAGRYLMVSAMGAADPPDGDEVFEVYLRAKAKADEALRDSGLAYTIVRPGRLTNDPATGRVEVGKKVERGEVPRADVAAVLAACLDHDETIGVTFELVSGSQPIDEALAGLG